jgi:2-polyprenyl-3-methyl-5-hydroxy-6-metoxy-1,4-benzoquinol methylase
MKFLSLFKSKTKKSIINDNESDFYEKMFTKNPIWNKPSPNGEELLRWNIIEGFVKFCRENNTEGKAEKFNILDLGCGRGWLTFLLSKYGDIVGIEPVKPVFKYAKKMFPHIKFICGTTKDLIKDNNCFNKYDLIVSSEVIEHIPDNEKEKFIEDISNLLKVNGFLIITTPRKEAQEEWSVYTAPDQPIEDWISEEELEILIVRKSFIKHKIERLSIRPIEGAREIEIYQLWLFQKI